MTNTNPQPAVTAATIAGVSPRSPAKGTASPWTQIVKGGETETPGSPSSAAVAIGVAKVENQVESGSDGNINVVVKKPVAWNKKQTMTAAPSSVNGTVESGGGVFKGIMAEEQWPSLSEGSKINLKNISETGSLSQSLQVTGTEISSSTVSSSVRSPSSASPKPTTSNSNHHPNANHGRPARQRSMKRDGNAGNPQANGASSQQQSQSAGEGFHHNHNQTQNSPKPTAGGVVESSGKDNVQNHSQRESGQRNAGGEHAHQRNSFRRGNGGPHPRGDGSHQNYGGRRNDQDRGNHDWNHQRSFNGRDAAMQSRVVSRGFVRPPPVTTTFVQHPPVRPFMNPMMPDMPPIVYLPPGMQFVAPVPPMYYPAPDPELYAEILKQINYYFSNENLVKDTYLRKNMDENGWVSVDLIANFNKVKSLTTDPYRILDAVKSSSVVEVQADKIRRRDDWMRWVLPAPVQIPTVSEPQPPEVPAVSALSTQIQSVMLDETIDNDNTKGQRDVSAASAPTGSLPSTLKTDKDEADSSGC